MTKLKVLLFDIENTPSLGWAWGKYEQNIIEFEKHWHMLSFSAKWLGSKKTIVKALPDYPLYKEDPSNDRELVSDLWKLLDEADVVIAHNGDNFDIKKSNTRFLFNDLNPPSPYKTVDTLKVAKKHFAFESNSLNDLAMFLGVGEKVDTGGFGLWTGCMRGDKASWSKMKEYNKHDVELLERVYLALRPWAAGHPRIEDTREVEVCHTCGSDEIQRRGYNYTKLYKYQRYCCLDCGAWTQGELVKKSKKNV